jgi:hypothetical protein
LSAGSTPGLKLRSFRGNHLLRRYHNQKGSHIPGPAMSVKNATEERNLLIPGEFPFII